MVATEAQRIDRWLWFARFFKSREGAARVCRGGRVRLNRQPVQKTSQPVRPGDVLTFSQGRRVRVIRVLAIASRRGPAVEAQQLYEDLSPPVATEKNGAPALAQRPAGAGRPTKAERRAIDRLRGGV